MSECNHDCSSCSANCESRTGGIKKEPLNSFSEVKKVIAVMSGKGGVGKSLVTSMLAVELNRRGRKTAVLDADLTGPSIPQAFGLHSKAEGCEQGIIPKTSKTGVKLMSLNLLLENETDPVAWRGPVIAGTVLQFWKDVFWGDVDFMFVDMPPGTGDVPLTVFQSLPVDGIIVVTSPQDLVGMIVEKAVRLAGLLNVPIIGMVENFSYFECPDCKSRHTIFGESKAEEAAASHGISALAKLPVNPKLAAAVDAGMIELFEQPEINPVADAIDKLLD